MVDKLVTVKTEPSNEEDYSNHLNNNNTKTVDSKVKFEENNCTPESTNSSDSDEQKPLIARIQKERKDNAQKTTKHATTKASRAAAAATAAAALASSSISSELKHEDDEADDGVLDENQIYKKRRPILLSAINSHIICGLCNGYLIDATTIVECLHSFCHSCLIKHLRVEQFCPKCEMMINTAKPNIKPDTTLQAIVYKLVPGLYEKELMRKRAFYKDRPEEAASATPEQRGDDTEHLIFSPSDYMSLSLEYADLADLAGSSASYYKELLKPRYLQCPAMYTVGHLKKFVYGKFEIDMDKFHIDIMYKVKTIVLLDHFTLMDVAYIYTWKRDAPMRFYFRVKRSTRPLNRIRKPINQEAVVRNAADTSNNESKELIAKSQASDVKAFRHMEVIKEETAEECKKVAPKSEVNTTSVKVTLPSIKGTSPSNKESLLIVKVPSPSSKFQVTSPSLKLTSPSAKFPTSATKETLPATKVPSPSTKVTSPSRYDHKHNKTYTDQQQQQNKTEMAGPKLDANQNKTSLKSNNQSPPEVRRTENIKLKIDLSKNSSVTIINMSDPMKKEITKPIKPEKEHKVKRHSYINHSKTEHPTNAAGRPLTVPPLTIKTDRITSFIKPKDTESMKKPKPAPVISDEDRKSQFLKSFALAPISEVKSSDSSPEKSPPSLLNCNKTTSMDLMRKMPPPLPVKASAASKRKSKEPIKAIPKKPRASPPLPTSDFKILLPPASLNNNINNTNSNKSRTPPTDAKSNKAMTEKFLMPPPPTTTLGTMRPPSAVAKKAQKQQSKSASAALPLLSHGVPVAPPGNRTPIAKRYQPILPKAARPNPFANLPGSDINFSAQDALLDLKPPAKESQSPLKVYGPKTDKPPLMEPPRAPIAQSMKPPGAVSAKKNESQNYLNFALFNSSKLKNNDVSLGCRTPVYTPSSPIYSPNSPQYVPNYNISPIPTYKYTTPKPSGNSTSYLQSILGGNKDMASLFPSPPVRKESPLVGTNNNNGNNNHHGSNMNHQNSNINHNNSNKQTMKPTNALKRPYTSMSNNSNNKSSEEPPEKSKVDALLNSCNINIPSSLSITITREDSETQSNNASYPKHKSPVNNYIEILKLPEQTTTDNVEKNTMVPQKNLLSMLPPAQPKRDIPDTKTNCLQTQPKKLPKLDLPGNDKANKKLVNNKPNPSAIALPKNIPATISLTATHDKTAPILTQASSKSSSFNQMKSEKISHSPEKKSGLVSSSVVDSSTTPHPRISPTTNGNAAEYVKSPQTSPESSMLQAGKRLRHILPRQNTVSIPEIIPPKVTTGTVIGTYASPSGVAVKIHATKKATQKNSQTTSPSASKTKLPSDGAQNNLSCNSKTKISSSITNTTANSKSITSTTLTTTTTPSSSIAALSTIPHVSTANKIKTSKSNASPTTTLSLTATRKTPPLPLPTTLSSSSTTTQINTASKPCTTISSSSSSSSSLRVNSPNELHNKNLQQRSTQAMPTTPLPTKPANKHTSPTPTTTTTATTATLEDITKSSGQQADLSKFLKDNLLRAQMQVAAANQSKMLYTYANAAAAAQMNPFTPSIYNYQQAYIMEQLTRMQRAGTEVFTEYMEKLKNGLGKSNMASEETQKATKTLALPTLPTTTISKPTSTTSSSSPSTAPTSIAQTFQAQNFTASTSSTATTSTTPSAGGVGGAGVTKRNANSPTIQKGQATSTAK